MFKQYRRTNIAEMQEWKPIGAPTHSDEVVYLQNLGVSISKADLDAGSPKIGDLIARNPENHNDMWLVAKEYAQANFKLIQPTK
jgi:hypothetical protein